MNDEFLRALDDVVARMTTVDTTKLRQEIKDLLCRRREVTITTDSPPSRNELAKKLPGDLSIYALKRVSDNTFGHMTLEREGDYLVDCIDPDGKSVHFRVTLKFTHYSTRADAIREVLDLLSAAPQRRTSDQRKGWEEAMNQMRERITSLAQWYEVEAKR